jgi:hypothetical protein
MRLTYQEQQVFRMLANARQPSDPSGAAGPLLFDDDQRKLALRLGEIGDNSGGKITLRAKEPRHLTSAEIDAALALLASDTAREWLRKWCHGDPSDKFMLDALLMQLRTEAAKHD